jgi:hypothetical protein
LGAAQRRVCTLQVPDRQSLVWWNASCDIAACDAVQNESTTRSLSVGGPVGVSAQAIAVATVFVFGSAKARCAEDLAATRDNNGLEYITSGMVRHACNQGGCGQSGRSLGLPQPGLAASWRDFGMPLQGIQPWGLRLEWLGSATRDQANPPLTVVVSVAGAGAASASSSLPPLSCTKPKEQDGYLATRIRLDGASTQYYHHRARWQEEDGRLD